MKNLICFGPTVTNSLLLVQAISNTLALSTFTTPNKAILFKLEVNLKMEVWVQKKEIFDKTINDIINNQNKKYNIHQSFFQG